MKSALTSIAQTLRAISSMEQSQMFLAESIARADKPVDKIAAIVKDEVKNHEKRIEAIEISIAKNQWIAPSIMAALMTGVAIWIKGGV